MTILVTGGTGFIGGALIRHLTDQGLSVRTLIRPSSSSPRLPKGVPVEVAVSSLTDERGLRAAMVGVDTVYHLAGAEWRGPSVDMFQVDNLGTRAVITAAKDAGVKRIFYISHLGVDRQSAYPVLKTKAIAEEIIRRSGLDYTILRTAIVYGRGDGLTNGLARILSVSPFIFLMPGKGDIQLQPLWVEDLVTCLVWSLEDPDTRNRIYEVGGPEYLTFRQVLELVMENTGMKRLPVSVAPPFLRGLTITLEWMFPSLPVSIYWMDYLAVNRTTAIDTMPRSFNLMPSRMSQRLAYLHDQDWRSSMFQQLRKRRE